MARKLDPSLDNANTQTIKFILDHKKELLNQQAVRTNFSWLFLLATALPFAILPLTVLSETVSQETSSHTNLLNITPLRVITALFVLGLGFFMLKNNKNKRTEPNVEPNQINVACFIEILERVYLLRLILDQV